MTEERKYAILFAATILCARKLIADRVGFGQTESGEGGCGRVRDQSSGVHTRTHRQAMAEREGALTHHH